MRQYDVNPALSAFTVVVGAILGILAAVLLGFGATGVFVMAIVGVLVAGLLASSLGLVGEKQRGGGGRDDDLPSHYHDY